ncbi:MAG TPA: hypothetical protein DCG28_01790 [Lachnospiraceae bacterium]|nr:hypothetical protein [Lachnospiraceae bacterium]
MSAKKTQLIMNVLSLLGIVASILFFVYAWREGIFKSQEKMENFVNGFGIWGYVIFVVIQIVQVIIPIIPGGVSCLVGVLLYGPVLGFILNYLGIFIGSMMVFAIARYYGRPILNKMFSEKLIKKYDYWTTEQKYFTKMFAFAIFFPVSPDDFLCYLAGTTKMRWRTFVLIMIFCKPFSIVVYSLGLTFIYDKIQMFLGG